MAATLPNAQSSNLPAISLLHSTEFILSLSTYNYSLIIAYHPTVFSLRNKVPPLQELILPKSIQSSAFQGSSTKPALAAPRPPLSLACLATAGLG